MTTSNKVSITLAAAIACAMGIKPALADDAEMLRQMEAQMAEMQAQIEAMQKRLARQEDVSADVAEKITKAAPPAAGTGKAVQVYGQLRASVDVTDNDTGSDGTEIVSNASRIGVKGELPTTLADTTLFYQAELRYEATDEANGDDSGEDGGDSKEVEFREGFVGLKGKFGKVRLGRLSTEYKKTLTKIDPWNDNAPQSRSGGRQGSSELHSSYFNNAVDYVTPKFGGGFTANAWYSTRNNGSSKNMHNAGALNNFKGGTAKGVGVKYKSGPLFLGVDWLDIDADTIAGGGVSNDSAWQIGAKYKVMDNLSLAGMYEDAEDIGLGKQQYVNGIYKLDKTRFIVGYGKTDDRVANGNKDWANWSVGVKYALTKKSELLAAYNQRQNDTDGLDFNTFTVGINAKFGY